MAMATPAADATDAGRPLGQHGDTVISYVIRGPLFGPGDTDTIFQDDGTDDAERLLRLAAAEAERHFELALAARTPETPPPRGHKRGRDDATTTPDGDEDGAARGAPRRVVTTATVAEAQDVDEEELEAGLPDATTASRPEHLTATALDEDGWQFADGDDTDGFLLVRPADKEEDEQFVFLPMDDDDYYGILYDWHGSVVPPADEEAALDEKLDDGHFAPSGVEDFIPLDPPEDEDDCDVVYGQCSGVMLDEVALGERGEQFASGTEDFIPLDPAEDNGQFASSENEDFIPLDPAEDDYGHCGVVMVNEVALQDEQFASSEAEDLLSLDQIESDDIVYDPGWLDRLIRPVLRT